MVTSLMTRLKGFQDSVRLWSIVHLDPPPEAVLEVLRGEGWSFDVNYTALEAMACTAMPVPVITVTTPEGRVINALENPEDETRYRDALRTAAARVYAVPVPRAA